MLNKQSKTRKATNVLAKIAIWSKLKEFSKSYHFSITPLKMLVKLEPPWPLIDSTISDAGLDAFSASLINSCTWYWISATFALNDQSSGFTFFTKLSIASNNLLFWWVKR